MQTSLLASTIFGTSTTIDGEPDRVRDLGAIRVGAEWHVVGVRSERGVASITGLTADGIEATAHEPVAVTWLRSTIFDRQVVDLDGRRVLRVGDVVLCRRGDVLAVEAVEVGAAAVIRRLGLKRLAARVRPKIIPIDRVHVPHASADALVLDLPRARLDELAEEEVVRLLARLPTAAAEHAIRHSRHRDRVRADHRTRHRRRRYPRITR